MGTVSANDTPRSGGSGNVSWSDTSGTALVRPDSDDALIPLTALARDTSGRATFTRERVGSAVAAAYSSNGATVDYSKSPVLYRSGRGPINYQPNWQGAVGFDGKIIAVTTAGTFFKWTAAAGQAQISATGAITGTIQVFFVDSRGYLYYATSTGNTISRSIDDGATWATVLTLPGSSDIVAPMCEDDQGNLYAAAYGTGTGGSALSVNSRTFYKSTDGGATWSDLSANLPGGSAAINRHIHGVWWDDHRKLLYLTHGDAGPSSVPYVSDDRGATFSTITGLKQCTAMIGTPTHVICTYDDSSDRRIYRIECSDKASLIANAKTVCYDWVADGGLADYTSTTNGFCWFGFEDNQGNVVVAYGKEGTRTSVIASADSGATWGELLTTAGGGGTRVFHDQCYVSPFHTGRDGFQYCYDSTLTSVSQWRVYAPGSAIIVDPTADPYVHDGISSPSAGMFAGELRAPGVIQRLAGDITVPILLGAAGVALDRRAYQAGKKLRSAPVVTETFEGTPSGWTNATFGSGAITLNDTTHVYAGTQALKCDLSAGSGAAGITYAYIRRTTAPWTAVSGSEIWFDGYVWVAAITSAALSILQWESTRIIVRTYGSTNRIGVFSTSTANYPGYQQDHEVVAFPTEQWVRLRVAIVAHNTNGRVRIWQDTGTGLRLVIDLMGVVTDSSSIGSDLLVGARTEASGNYTTVWYDNVLLGFNQDPTSPAALTMAVGTALLPDGIYA